LINYTNSLVYFLKRSSDETINKGAAILEDIAKNEKGKWVRYYGQKGISDLIKMYQEREDETKKKIDDLKATSPTAPGLQKLQDDLVKIQAQKDKLGVIYNDLVKLEPK